MRTDIQMKTGKLAAMASHCASNTLIQYLIKNPTHLEYFAELGHSGSRVVLKAKSLQQIERIEKEAKEANLPYYVMVDSGHIHPPHFDGSPVIVGIGLGPVTREQANHITKRYQLFV